MTTLPLARPDSPEPPRRRWTRQEYHRLAEMGFLTEEDRYELIEGDLLKQMPQDRRHVFVCMRILELLLAIYGRGRVQSQAPVRIDPFNEPEPDATVLRDTLDAYMEDSPGAEDVLLVVEVSNTTLRFDTTVKASLYARAGMPEYWVLDLNARTLLVLRNPGAEGYTSATTFTEADRVTPLSAPDASLAVAEMLPPVTPAP